MERSRSLWEAYQREYEFLHLEDDFYFEEALRDREEEVFIEEADSD